MKTLFLIIALVVFSVSITAQNYAKVSKTSIKTEPSFVQKNPSSTFTKDVLVKENFKYRDYLNNARKSDEIVQLGQKIYTTKQLAELLRKNAIKALDQKEFVQLLVKENFHFKKDFSNEELVLLYQKFREGSLKKYVEDLATDW